jgi:hypothetical protein
MTLNLKNSSNEFESQTKNSNEKRYRMFTYHRSKVKKAHEDFPTDADFIVNNDRTEPLFQSTKTVYDFKYSVKGLQYGQTELVKERIKAIKGERGLAHDWNNRVKAIYNKSNPSKVTAIFPFKLKPFSETYDIIVSSLHGMSLAIGTDTNPLMIAIKAEIDAEYAIINPARELQQTDIGNTESTNDSLDSLCEQCMLVENQNSHRLAEKYPHNENNIQESFHDMELLKSKQQTVWNIGLNPLETKDIAQRTLIAQSKFRAKATGGSAMMYLASTPGSIDSTGVPLVDGIENKFTAAEFHVTDYGVNRHITVVNGANNPIRFNLDLG